MLPVRFLILIGSCFLGGLFLEKTLFCDREGDERTYNLPAERFLIFRRPFTFAADKQIIHIEGGFAKACLPKGCLTYTG